MFEMRRLRIDEEPRRHREGWPLGRLGKPGESERTPETYRPAQDSSGQFDHARKLARAAGQHHAPARLGRKGRCRQTVANHLQYLLDAWLDDAYQRSARDELRWLALVIAERRHGDHVALIRAARQNTAIDRLDSLGIGDARVEPARQVHRDVRSAKREAIGMHESSA